MPADVIVLNGGSSAGKSSLVAELQARLDEPWLAVGVDTFVEALPPRLTEGGDGIGFADDGRVDVGEEFTRLETCWAHGVAAMARAGARIVVDDVFLGGPPSQRRWATALEGLDVLWVGVRCAPDVAAARERARGDRPPGMAELQAVRVHRGIRYDVEVDTSSLTTAEAARAVLDALR